MLDLQKLYPQQLDDPLYVANICYNTNDITSDSCFVALNGMKVDGHKFVRVAEEKGARAVIVEQVQEGLHIPQILVNDTHEALSILSKALYNPTLSFELFPIAGITGTDGKTSTATIVQELLKLLGENVGYIGTNGIFYQNKEINLQCTTPLAPELHEIISEMHKGSVDFLAMEVSSHALATKRVENVRFQYGVFTNLSHDHLDFHKTFENYKESKFHLFQLILPSGMAIINLDDKVSKELIHEISYTVTIKTTSLQNKSADLYADNIQYSIEGMSFDLYVGQNKHRLTTQLLGAFNVSNIMSAILIAQDKGYSLTDIFSCIPLIPPIKGRMELLHNKKEKIGVIVDFGHAPHAIKNVLVFARKLNPTRLTVITGAVGDGDSSKRPEMAKNAVKYADRFIATMDNPYSEPADDILNELLEQLEDGSYIRVPQRQDAIDYALESAITGELIVILGRGREDIITNGKTSIHLNDYKYAKEKLKQIGKKDI